MEAGDAQQNNSESRFSLSVPVSIVLAGLLIAGAVWFKGGGKVDTTAAVGQKGRPAKVELGDLPVLGEAKAKVEIVEFGDYQCPFCRRQFMEVEPLLREQYIKTGKAKMVWRDFAFLGPESVWAAEAARCANDQGKFWQYHDLLFNRQNGENQGAFNKDNLKKFAGELGLNQPEFDTCLESGRHTAAVQADTEAGRVLGVGGTPHTYVNGVGVEGAQPFGVFKNLIDKSLE